MVTKNLQDFLRGVAIEIFRKNQYHATGNDIRKGFDSTGIDFDARDVRRLGLADGQGFELSYHGKQIGHLFHSCERTDAGIKRYFSITFEPSIEGLFEQGHGRDYILDILGNPSDLRLTNFKEIPEEHGAIKQPAPYASNIPTPQPEQQALERLRASGQIR